MGSSKKTTTNSNLFSSQTLAVIAASCFLQTLQKGSLWAILPTILKASDQATRYGTVLGCANALGLWSI